MMTMSHLYVHGTQADPILHHPYLHLTDYITMNETHNGNQNKGTRQLY